MYEDQMTAPERGTPPGERELRALSGPGLRQLANRCTRRVHPLMAIRRDEASESQRSASTAAIDSAERVMDAFDQRRDAAIGAALVVIAKSIEAVGHNTPGAEGLAIAGIWRDLKASYGRQDGDPPTQFGPMWPDGPPANWPPRLE